MKSELHKFSNGIFQSSLSIIDKMDFLGIFSCIPPHLKKGLCSNCLLLMGRFSFCNLNQNIIENDIK